MRAVAFHLREKIGVSRRRCGDSLSCAPGVGCRSWLPRGGALGSCDFSLPRFNVLLVREWLLIQCNVYYVGGGLFGPIGRSYYLRAMGS